jgi:hypothetical protein
MWLILGHRPNSTSKHIFLLDAFGVVACTVTSKTAAPETLARTSSLGTPEQTHLQGSTT